MTRRYYFLYRPPAIGTHPIGETGRETWMPRRQVPEVPRQPAFGWVEYPDPLPLEDVISYELLPQDEEERARLTLWNRYGPNAEETLRYYRDKVGRERTERLAESGDSGLLAILYLWDLKEETSG